MAQYCLKCSKTVAVTSMYGHVINCFGDDRASGKFSAEDWQKAEASPKLLAELYYTTVDPNKKEITFAKTRDVIWEGLFHAGVRPSVQQELIATLNSEVKLGTFDWRNFQARLAISGTVDDDKVYYRKMSQAEYDASILKPNRFKAAFDWTNTPLYRYWMSSSLAKVQAFGNENAMDAGFIVKITFTESPLKKFTIKAHQQPGVQNDVGVVALHREGFAELGSFNCDAHVKEITGAAPKLDYNLGFTANQSAGMFAIYDSFTRV